MKTLSKAFWETVPLMIGFAIGMFVLALITGEFERHLLMSLSLGAFAANWTRKR